MSSRPSSLPREIQRYAEDIDDEIYRELKATARDNEVRGLLFDHFEDGNRRTIDAMITFVGHIVGYYADVDRRSPLDVLRDAVKDGVRYYVATLIEGNDRLFNNLDRRMQGEVCDVVDESKKLFDEIDRMYGNSSRDTRRDRDRDRGRDRDRRDDRRDDSRGRSGGYNTSSRSAIRERDVREVRTERVKATRPNERVEEVAPAKQERVAERVNRNAAPSRSRSDGNSALPEVKRLDIINEDSMEYTEHEMNPVNRKWLVDNGKITVDPASWRTLATGRTIEQVKKPDAEVKKTSLVIQPVDLTDSLCTIGVTDLAKVVNWADVRLATNGVTSDDYYVQVREGTELAIPATVENRQEIIDNVKHLISTLGLVSTWDAVYLAVKTLEANAIIPQLKTLVVELNKVLEVMYRIKMTIAANTEIEFDSFLEDHESVKACVLDAYNESIWNSCNRLSDTELACIRGKVDQIMSVNDVSSIARIAVGYREVYLYVGFPLDQLNANFTAEPTSIDVTDDIFAPVCKKLISMSIEYGAIPYIVTSDLKKIAVTRGSVITTSYMVAIVN